MTTKIFYFSGTGNTLKLAKDLSAEMGEVELIRISYNMDFNQQDCDVVGIAYPVYCFGPPNVVKNFVDKVQLSPNSYIFGLASYGGLLTSSGMILKKQLQGRGYTLSAGFAVNLPGNAQTVYDVAKQEKIDSMVSNAKKKIKEIANVVKKKEVSRIETNLGLLGKLMSGLSPGMMSKINTTAKSFYVEEKCDSCKICAKVCPVNNITIEDGKPKWSDKCESCLACLHWCPKAAIQASEKTKKRGRYHHPEIHLNEMLVSND